MSNRLKMNLQFFASTTTKVADVIQPEVFTPLFFELHTE